MFVEVESGENAARRVLILMLAGGREGPGPIHRAVRISHPPSKAAHLIPQAKAKKQGTQSKTEAKLTSALSIGSPAMRM